MANHIGVRLNVDHVSQAAVLSISCVHTCTLYIRGDAGMQGTAGNERGLLLH